MNGKHSMTIPEAFEDQDVESVDMVEQDGDVIRLYHKHQGMKRLLIGDPFDLKHTQSEDTNTVEGSGINLYARFFLTYQMSKFENAPDYYLAVIEQLLADFRTFDDERMLLRYRLTIQRIEHGTMIALALIEENNDA